MFQRGPWLGQVPLVPNPSWMTRHLSAANQGTPPYYGQWGVHGGESGQVGPFDTQDEAFNTAVKAAREAGAKALPADGYARVVDSAGQNVGPTT